MKLTHKQYDNLLEELRNTMQKYGLERDELCPTLPDEVLAEKFINKESRVTILLSVTEFDKKEFEEMYG